MPSASTLDPLNRRSRATLGPPYREGPDRGQLTEMSLYGGGMQGGMYEEVVKLLQPPHSQAGMIAKACRAVEEVIVKDKCVLCCCLT